MKTISVIAVAVALLIVLAFFLIFLNVIYKERNYANFQRSMKQGDLCRFYLGEEKMEGEILDIYSNGLVYIDSAYGQFLTNKSEVHPFYH